MAHQVTVYNGSDFLDTFLIILLSIAHFFSGNLLTKFKASGLNVLTVNKSQLLSYVTTSGMDAVT